MNKILIILFLLTGVAQAQTAQQIIEQHLQNSGGIHAWNQLNSILVEAEVSVDVSEVVSVLIEHKRPYFKRVSYIINNKEQLSEGYDGRQAFTFNELNGKYRLLSNYTPDSFETDILNYEKKGFRAELIGKEKLNGKEVFKIKLIKNTIVDYYYFDTENYQLLREENQLEAVNYSDFKSVKGLSFAHRIEATPIGGKEYVVVMKKIVPNAAIDDSRFKFN
ncbi:MAG: hypothetical protein Q4G27_03745 [Flavobacteriaceae bacterium]|nr:hypothetical protein [Flavobacteriaceae bacterium]